MADLEVLDRAAVDADLPGMLRAYGWQAVRDEDALDRRVLTDSEETRRVVVWRHPEDGHWQWWDVAVEIVGDIVDACRQLMGFQWLRDIIGLLRFALATPPGPLPVAEVRDEDAASDYTNARPVTGQHLSVGNLHHDHSPQTMVPEQTITSMSIEDPVALDEEGAQDTSSAQSEQQDNGEETAPESDAPKPPRQGRRR